MKIVVVIPCRNDAGFLQRCLTALDLQTRGSDQVIVVDNASIDDTSAVARAHGATLVCQNRRGIWPAASTGYDKALAEDADIIARLDADSVPPENWLARIERAFRVIPSLEGITGPGRFYGTDPIRKWIGEHLYLGAIEGIVHPWLGHPMFFGSNMAMRAELWKQHRHSVLSHRSDIHDDLDLSLQLRPGNRIIFDRSLVVDVSGRPLDSFKDVTVRVGKAFSTFYATWPQANPFLRRREATGPSQSNL